MPATILNKQNNSISRDDRVISEPELAIVGAVPPPFGGVTVHILRLANRLTNLGVRFRIVNLNSSIEDHPTIVSWRRRTLRRISAWVFRSPEKAVVVMNKRISVWLFFAMIGCLRRQRILIRLQGSDLVDWKQQRRWKLRLAAVCLRRVSGVVCVNSELADAVIGLGVDPSRVLLMPGFLPPAPEELDSTKIEKPTASFLAAHSPIIAANGKVAQHAGEDLYGLDLLVELLRRLNPSFPNAGLIVCLATPSKQEQQNLNGLIARATALGLEGKILFQTTAGFFLPVLARASVFVRPTNTEGDSNSVREALSLGIPTVASDVAERPPGTVLFRNRDLDDLALKTTLALANATSRKSNQRSTQSKGQSTEDERIKTYVEFLLGRSISLEVIQR